MPGMFCIIGFEAAGFFAGVFVTAVFEDVFRAGALFAVRFTPAAFAFGVAIAR